MTNFNSLFLAKQETYRDTYELKTEEMQMVRYKNLGGNSGIYAYSIGTDYIDVQFDRGKVYRYSYRSAGKEKVEQMKKLAVQGQGLNAYIMRNARYDYER